MFTFCYIGVLETVGKTRVLFSQTYFCTVMVPLSRFFSSLSSVQDQCSKLGTSFSKYYRLKVHGYFRVQNDFGQTQLERLCSISRFTVHHITPRRELRFVYLLSVGVLPRRGGSVLSSAVSWFLCSFPVGPWTRVTPSSSPSERRRSFPFGSES